MVADHIPNSIEEPPYAHWELGTAPCVRGGCGHHLEYCIPEAHVIGANRRLFLAQGSGCALQAPLTLLVEISHTGPQSALHSLLDVGRELEAALAEVEETRCWRDEMDHHR